MVASKEQSQLAVAALLAHLKEKRSETRLFNEEDTIWMQVTLINPPPKQLKAKKIPLPHPFADGAEICLITKEPGKDVKAKLQKAGISNITKVISLTKLRKEYKSFKLKIELCDRYDLFIVDDRVYNLVLKTLGKTFNKAAKEPLPICLTYPNLKEEVQKTLLCSVLKVAHGHTSCVRVGHSGLTAEQLTANVMHAAKVIATKVPGGSNNIRGLYIKSSLSVALPLYSNIAHLNDKGNAKDIGKAGTTGENLETMKADEKVKKLRVEENEASAEEAKALDQHAEQHVQMIKNMNKTKKARPSKKKKAKQK